MNRLPRLAIALLTPFVLVWSAGAYAQSCSNGKTLYTKTTANLATSCSNSNCHGTNPGNNKNNILTGAGPGGADVIDQALDYVNEMQSANIRSELNLQYADLEDIAEYLSYGMQQAARPPRRPTSPPTRPPQRSATRTSARRPPARRSPISNTGGTASAAA